MDDDELEANEDEGLDLIEQMDREGLLLAARWDACHVVQLAVGQTALAQFRTHPWEHQIEGPGIGATVHGWYDRSCALRFVNALTGTGRRDQDHLDIIGQDHDPVLVQSVLREVRAHAD